MSCAGPVCASSNGNVTKCLFLLQAIAKELARKLGMGTNILTLPRGQGTGADANMNKSRLKEAVEDADGFAQVSLNTFFCIYLCCMHECA